jgi:hypothetical protein
MRTHRLRVALEAVEEVDYQTDAIAASDRDEITEKLNRLNRGAGADRSGWGALGPAAEFPAAQRGPRS